MTETLPKEVAILGLDLSSKPHVIGWFLLAITVYFFIIFCVIGILDLIKYYLPSYIASKEKNLTGHVLGLSEDECSSHFEPHHLDMPEVGTPSSELSDIHRQKAELGQRYNSKFITFSNFIKISFDLILPIVFWLAATYVLSRFLWLSSQ